MSYGSEAAKVRDMPYIMSFIAGDVVDVGCGHDKIISNATGVDGRKLPGVNFITDMPTNLSGLLVSRFDTVFSSHFLEHISDQWGAVIDWRALLRDGGHLVLYLPDGRHYNNKANPEHMIDMNYDDFMFWFKRSFCGEGKDFTGNHFPKLFELIDSGMDVGPDRYSFYVIARKV